MSDRSCTAPLSFERFVDYWFGDLPAAERDSVEEHLFACASCGKKAEVWAIDLQALARGGAELPRAFLTNEQLAALGDKAVVVDVSSAQTTIVFRPHSVQVFRIALDEKVLSELERLDLEYVKEGMPEPVYYVSSIPLPKQSGVVHFACHSHVFQAHGGATMRLIGTRRGRQFTVLESLVQFA